MNNFSFTGRLTRDAESRSTPSGLSILKFSVANNTGFGDKQKTNFVNCALFGKRAEGGLKNLLKKGQEVAVTGELNLNEFTKQDGTKSASLECNVNSVDLIGSKSQSNTQNSPAPITSEDKDDVPF
jgi:single-strand DNA-binding protein